jgi:WD40 repeat protein
VTIQQILQRTTGSQTLPNALRPTSSAGASVQEDAKHQHAAMSAHAPPQRSDTNEPARKELKKGVKAVTFLGRLIGGKKKSPDQAIADDDAVESRPEGTEAHVFAQPLDSMEYNPRHPPPPAYIKVRSKFKARRDFDRLFLAQELYCGKRRKLVRTETNKLRRKSSASTDQEAVWAMEFSKDGRFLAAAGADMVLRVWQVLSNPEDRRKTEASSTGDSRNGVGQGERLSAPVFATEPIREWAGHGSTILDLSWSKNNFLLSSSMDKTVRLWHVSRKECICTFKHNDFVPSIAFHPKDDRFFLAGSLDSKLRLWSIPDKSVAFTVQAPEMITAVAFTPDGRYAMAGCLDGQCLFYETESLKYQTQLHVRSAKGPNARGSKITAIQAYHGSSGDVKLLITSNDSRVRLYNFRDKSLELKFRGMQNNASQIRATLSDDGRYVVCGSEDRKAFIWSLNGVQDDARDKQPVEIFEAHESPTTVACFAPAKTRHILGRSEDPVYDLCNPPPVTLLSQRERTESHASSRPATENGSYMRTSLDVRGSLDRPRESFVHTAKSLHKSGNIIVTADFTGTIKIFRQDCAWNKRKGEDWDRSSVFGKRSGGGGGKSSRSNSIAGASIATKASQRSLRDGRTSAASQNAPSDRILSWRQGIACTSNVTNGSGASQKSKATSRSVSPPQKSPDTNLSNLRSPKSSGEGTSPTSTAPTSLEVTDSQDTVRRTLQEHRRKNDPNEDNNHHNHAPNSPTESPDSDIARRRDEGDGMVVDAAGRSDFFWDTARLREPLERQRALKAQAEDDERNARFLDRRPSRVSVNSAVSRLTAENSGVSDIDGEEDEFNDAEEEGPEKRMVCRRCGGTGFAAMRGAEGFRLVCEGCGLRVKPPVDG